MGHQGSPWSQSLNHWTAGEVPTTHLFTCQPFFGYTAVATTNPHIIVDFNNKDNSCYMPHHSANSGSKPVLSLWLCSIVFFILASGLQDQPSLGWGLSVCGVIGHRFPFLLPSFLMIFPSWNIDLYQSGIVEKGSYQKWKDLEPLLAWQCL